MVIYRIHPTRALCEKTYWTCGCITSTVIEEARNWKKGGTTTWNGLLLQRSREIYKKIIQAKGY